MRDSIHDTELFESLTISTYNNGVFVESRTGIDLIDLAVLILFISADEGVYNVGFQTTQPFDEIRITAGSLATAINQVHVYSAFVDTRTSDGDPLFCNLLPVKWLSFDVKKSGNASWLNWATAEEVNVLIFDIERSGDGIHFQKIGETAASGLQGQIQAYEFYDRSPLDGINYYRIRENDIDGKFQYSPVRNIYFQSNGFTVRVFPNPVSNIIRLEIVGQELEASRVKIINASGNIVLDHQLDLQKINEEIDVALLPQGIYTLILESSSQYIVEKLVVVK